MVGGGVPLYVKILPKLTHPLQKCQFPINIHWYRLSLSLSEKVQLTRIQSPLQAFQ